MCKILDKMSYKPKLLIMNVLQLMLPVLSLMTSCDIVTYACILLDLYSVYEEKSNRRLIQSQSDKNVLTIAVSVCSLLFVNGSPFATASLLLSLITLLWQLKSRNKNIRVNSCHFVDKKTCKSVRYMEPPHKTKIPQRL